MFQSLIEEYQAVNATLCFLDHSQLCLSSSEIDALKDACKMLQHFERATREISANKYLSISKVIPLARSLQRATIQCSSSRGRLKDELVRSMAKRFTGLESHYSLAVSTLCWIPGLKKIGFGDPSAYNNTVQRLTAEVAAIVAAGTQGSSSESRSSSPRTEDVVFETDELWSFIDESVAATQSRPSTSDAKVMIRTYTEHPNLARKEDPLKWWAENEKCFPFLLRLCLPRGYFPRQAK